MLKRHRQTAKQSSKSDTRSSSSYFSQVVSIPKDGDVENIVSEFKEGILKISIPKLDKPRAQTKKITIQ
jgi:HSP20 family protein